MEQLKSLLVVVAIPALLSLGLLWIAGGGDGVYVHEGVARFDHPRETVYEWLVEPRRRLAWVEGLLSCEPDRRSIEAGAVLREVVQEGDARVARTVEVIEATEGELFAFRVREPGRTLEVRMKVGVLNTGRKSRIDYHATCTFDAWWARLLEPVLGSRVIRGIEDDLARLDVAMRGA